MVRRSRSRALRRARSGKSAREVQTLNTKPVCYTTTLALSGANTTGATSAGYAWYTISSAAWTSSSPWTQLAALYDFVRPLGAKATVAYCRATGTSDNPRVVFVPTPDGTPVGNAGMNISTLEAATGKGYTLGPGEEVSFWYQPKVAVAVYATPTNGYMSVAPGKLSLDSLPITYYGDILFSTPGVTLTSTANYVSIKIEFVFEFSVLKPTNVQ